MKVSSLAIAIFTFLLSGCATIPDPTVHVGNKTLQASNIKPSKVLFVIDFSLEDPKMNGTMFAKKEVFVDKSYGNLGRIVTKRIKDQGIDADFVLHSSPLPFSLPANGYSHVLVEKILRFTVQTSSQYGDYISGRLWSAALYETNSSSQTKSIFNELYSSDGVICAQGTMGSVANESNCKNKYIEHLLSHLAPIGITNNPIENK